MNKPIVLIPDLHISNTASVVNMLYKCEARAEVITQPEMLTGNDKIILAGVGAFDAGMKSLNEGGWVDPLTKLVTTGQAHILGICLGMQLMCNTSEEGQLPGLGWFDAEVKKLSFPTESKLKIPHMGWNTVSEVKSRGLIDTDSGEQRFYFVHSYHVVCHHPENVIATTHYGRNITAAINKGNLYGVQFHPEKSHRFGMALLRNFIEL